MKVNTYTLIYQISKGAFVTGLRPVVKTGVLADHPNEIVIDTTTTRNPDEAIRKPFYETYDVSHDTDDQLAVLVTFDQHARMLFPDSKFAYSVDDITTVQWTPDVKRYGTYEHHGEECA